MCHSSMAGTVISLKHRNKLSSRADLLQVLYLSKCSRADLLQVVFGNIIVVERRRSGP